ncbi:MAG: hypothetical protein Q8876_06050 [Bacillota bacterium]|nr:hypothetical protein [Bacillota bacterium]
MACFTAPLAEAIIVTIIKKRIEKKEKATLSLSGKDSTKIAETENHSGIPFSRKIGWLTKMLWGGSFLLAIEHIWHGEVVPWAPFLTAMNNPADIQPMLMEIATVGVTMALLVTAVWVVMLAVSKHLENRKEKNSACDKAIEG